MISSDLENKTVQLELEHYHGEPVESGQIVLGNVQQAQRYIETETGILTVVKGLGSVSSAVAELRPSDAADDSYKIMGIVRLSQLSNNFCFVDGSITNQTAWSNTNKKTEPDSLANGTPTKFSVAIHEFGDLGGEAFNSIGEPLVEIDDEVSTTSSGAYMEKSIRRVIPRCNVMDMIGRSIAVRKTSSCDNPILSAGVIARAATVESNKKQICSCSGKTIWQERIERQTSDTTK